MLFPRKLNFYLTSRKGAKLAKKKVSCLCVLATLREAITSSYFSCGGFSSLVVARL